ncbi:hypothetical protein ABZW10_33145 [Kitasatospora sp. NPDC004723]|uniref:hypothetical protein n=1 Tax=Kitasatospora sp. NPDC004723 TaxID=3154288 RepID=UPI0033BEC796
MNRRALAATLAAAAVLTAAGCSSGAAKKTGDPTEDVRATAKRYQDAANKGDWPTACPLMSARLRGGDVQHCLDDHAANPASVEHASPSPTASPSPVATYADGSTVPPPATAKATGPDYADTSPVTLGDVIQVPAAGAHPAGYGVLATWSVTWPGKTPETDRRALRLVAEEGGWRVDQHEDNIKGAGELRTVLGG